jgi:hypothetical protein
MVDPGAAVGVMTWPVGSIDLSPKFPTGSVVRPAPPCAKTKVDDNPNTNPKKKLVLTMISLSK